MGLTALDLQKEMGILDTVLFLGSLDWVQTFF